MIRHGLFEVGNLCLNFARWNRPTTWCVARSIYCSSVRLKKRQNDETMTERTAANMGKHKRTPVIDVWNGITVSELAGSMGKDVDTLMSVLEYVEGAQKLKKNSLVPDLKMIEAICKKMHIRYKLVPKPEGKPEDKFNDVVRRDPSQYIDVRSRPPVVTIMGHVDHGKTTLLDSLRHSHVVDTEFGGITQHIGAFSVIFNEKDRITFLDTPGHAAFCAMRNRGAQCTDVVVLVVAADDGVMEQTIESIRMAKEANVPIIVAINKIDKQGADIDRTKKMLVQHEIQVEDYGGEIQAVPISALKGTNLDVLLDSLLVQSEVMELKADYCGPVEAVIIESSTDSHRGKLCTILVQVGTLRKGAVLVAGSTWCKVRSMFDDKGQLVKEATPSTPVEVLGWRELPFAGDLVLEVESEKRAHEIVSHRQREEMKKKQEDDSSVIKEKAEEHSKKHKEELIQRRKEGRYRARRTGPREKEIQNVDEGPRLNILIKGDVVGSVEALLDVIETYQGSECILDVVHYGVGPVSPSDISLASAFNAVIYTFNTTILDAAKSEASQSGVKIKPFKVIYKLIDSIKDEMNSLLPEKTVDDVLGEANVLQEFVINEGKSKIPVAGCRCVKGLLKKSAFFKVIRGQEVIYNGTVASLRHLKNEVDTIKKDIECGIRMADTTVRFQPGDSIVCFKLKNLPQKITWDPGF